MVGQLPTYRADFNNFIYGDQANQNVTFSNFERFDITTGSGDDQIGTAQFSGNDVVNLGAGNDRALTGDGDDEANGGAGNDNIDVGTGDDTADGGADTDRISANLSAAVSSIVWILRAISMQARSAASPISNISAPSAPAAAMTRSSPGREISTKRSISEPATTRSPCRWAATASTARAAPTTI
jgi:hypothetical protein